MLNNYFMAYVIFLLQVVKMS